MDKDKKIKELEDKISDLNAHIEELEDAIMSYSNVFKKDHLIELNIISEDDEDEW